MPNDLTEAVGFVHRSNRQGAGAVRPVELIATVALALCTLVAVTAVSIGMARADSLAGIAESDGATLAIGIVIALLLSGMGGLTAMMAKGRHG